MNKKQTLKYFNQYLPMIEKAVWSYSKKYGLEREDIESQAFLIFCKATKNYDKTRACFSTHLTHELGRLGHYSQMEFRKLYKDVNKVKTKGKTGYGKNVYTNRNEITEVPYYDIFDRIIDKMDYEISLSDDAKKIVDYILSREWEIIGSNYKPRLSYIKMIFTELS